MTLPGPVWTIKVNFPGLKSYEDLAVADAPSAFWRFADTAGTVAMDRVGGQHGTYAGGYTLNTASLLVDDPTVCVKFNGTTGYMSAPDSTALDVADVFTFATVIKLAATGVKQYLAAKGATAWAVFVDTDNKVHVEKKGTAGDIAASSTTLDTSAHHVMVTKNGATTAIYIDGMDVTVANVNQTCANTATAQYIAQDSAGANFSSATFGPTFIDSAALSPAVAAHLFLAFSVGEFGGSTNSIAATRVESGKRRRGGNADRSGDQIGELSLVCTNTDSFFSENRNRAPNPSMEYGLHDLNTTAVTSVGAAATALNWVADPASAGGSYAGRASLSGTLNSMIWFAVEGLFPSGVPVSITAKLKSISGNVNVEVGLASQGTPADLAHGSGTIGAAYASAPTATLTPSADRTDLIGFIRTTTAAAAVVDFDQIQVNTGSTANTYLEGAPTWPMLNSGAPIIVTGTYANVSAAATRFALPATTATVNITVSDQTGATDMSAEIQAQIASAANGRILLFPLNAIIRIDTRLTIYSRNDLDINLNGSSFRNGTTGVLAASAIQFDIYNSTDIKLRNGDLRGKNTDPGKLSATTSDNDQGHNVSINDCIRVEVTGITATDAWGDFVQVAADTPSQTSNIWVHGNTVTNCGRSMVSVLNGSYIWFEDNTLGQSGLQTFNIEPYQGAGATIDHVWFTRNGGTQNFANVVSGANFGVWFAANGTVGTAVSDVVVDSNTMSAKVMQTEVSVLPRRQRITITNNTSTFTGAPLYGGGGVIDLAHVDGVNVYGNTQPLSSGVLTSFVDCTSVVTSSTYPYFYGWIQRVTPTPDDQRVQIVAYDALKLLGTTTLSFGVTSATHYMLRHALVENALRTSKGRVTNWVYGFGTQAPEGGSTPWLDGWSNKCANPEAVTNTTGWTSTAANLGFTATSQNKDDTDSNTYSIAGLLTGTTVYIAVTNYHATSANTVSLAGGTTTWVSIATTQFDGNKGRLTVFRGIPSAATAITITVGGAQVATGAAWHSWQMGGTDTSGTFGSGTVIQSSAVTSSAATITASFSGAVASPNSATFVAMSGNGGGPTAGTGFTNGTAQLNGAPVYGLNVGYTTFGGYWSTDATSSGATAMAAIIIEVKAAAAATTTITRVTAGSYTSSLYATAFQVAATGSQGGMYYAIPTPLRSGRAYQLRVGLDTLAAGSNWIVGLRSLGSADAVSTTATPTIVHGTGQFVSLALTPTADRSDMVIWFAKVAAASSTLTLTAVMVSATASSHAYARTGFTTPSAPSEANTVTVVAGGYTHVSCYRVLTYATAGSGVSMSSFLSPTIVTPQMFWVAMRGAVGGESVAVGFGDPYGSAPDAATTTFVLTTGWALYPVVWTPAASDTNLVEIFVIGTAASAITFDIDDAVHVIGTAFQPYVVAESAGVDTAEGNVLADYTVNGTAAGVMTTMNAANAGRNYILPLTARPWWKLVSVPRQTLATKAITQTWTETFAYVQNLQKDMDLTYQQVNCYWSGGTATATSNATVTARAFGGISRTLTIGDATLNTDLPNAQAVADLELARYQVPRLRPQIITMNDWVTSLTTLPFDIISWTFARQKINGLPLLCLSQSDDIGVGGESLESTFDNEELVRT